MTSQTEINEESQSAKWVKAIRSITVPFRKAVAEIIESTEVGNTLAVFDSGNTDLAAIAKDGSEWVVKNLIGAL